MPFDASERAFKIFTEAYGKAWSPRPSVSATMAAPREAENAPLVDKAPSETRARSKRRLPSTP